MKYLRIRNKGLIQEEDIILIGSSTKRGDSAKIGQFGSGWKYALAWLMRNDATPIVWAGGRQIIIESRMQQHRNNVVSIIIVNGRETSITTDMGMKWTAWMALRELISNAIDEGEEIVEQTDAISVDDNYTNIYIPMTPSIKEVIDNYEHYFAFDREPEYIGKKGAIYIRQTNATPNIYRKGIRCFDPNFETKIDINFNEIEITEDRLIDGGNITFHRQAAKVLGDCDDIPCLMAAIMSDYTDFHPDYPNENYITAYKKLVSQGIKFTTRTYSKVLGIVSDGHTIPSGHFKVLVDKEIISNPMGAIFKHLDFVFNRVDDDGKGAMIEVLLSPYGEFKVYFGKMDAYQPIKVKENEFYIKDENLSKDAKYLAAKCLIAHAEGAEILAKHIF